MLPRIEASDVIRRFTEAVKQHNANCPTVTHTRKTANGPIPVERKVGTIKTPITTTFHAFLIAYIHNYNKMCEILPVELQDINQLPALRTNSVKVGKHIHCWDRTIRNRMTILKNLKAIETKSHGSQQDYELWITPRFLFGDDAEKNSKKPLEMPSEGLGRKIFPHTYTHLELKNKLETTNKDMLIKDQHDIYLTQEKSNTGEAVKGDSFANAPSTGLFSNINESSAPAPWLKRAQIVAENTEKRIKKGDKLMAELAAKVEARKPKLPSGVDGNFAKMLAQFWIYAMQLLYSQRSFGKEQQEKALKAIFEGVYEKFEEKKSPKQWQEFQDYQLEKLEKVAKYLHKNPAKYASHPFSLFGKGKGYFDLGNKNGFAGVDEWMTSDKIKKNKRQAKALAKRQAKKEAAQQAADQERRKAERCELLLNQANDDFEKLVRCIEPRTEVAHFTSKISLYRFWHERFGGQGIFWQEKFHQNYLEMESRGFISPNFHKNRRNQISSGEIDQVTTVYLESWMHYGEGFYS